MFAAWLDDFIGVCKGTEAVGVLGPSSTASRTGFGVDVARARGERAGPPPVAAWPGSVPPLCHHLLAKATRPSAGHRVQQNWLLQQPLELKALTNTGSLKIAVYFARGANAFPASTAGTAGRAYKK